MKFTLDQKEMFSHLVLNDRDMSVIVAKTSQWQDNKELEAKLTINGVEVPAESLDRLLNQLWEQAQVESGREEFNLQVEYKAREILKTLNKDIYEKAYDIQLKLEAFEEELKFPWEG